MVDIARFPDMPRLSFVETRTLDVYLESDVFERARVILCGPARSLEEGEAFVKGIYMERDETGPGTPYLIFRCLDGALAGLHAEPLDEILEYEILPEKVLVPKNTQSYPVGTGLEWH